MISLKLNGRPHAIVEDVRIERVRSDRVWALLGLLALNPGSWAMRVDLAQQLWPESTETVARKRLRQTLLYVRDALGPDVLDTTVHALRLKASIDCDVAEHGALTNFLDGLFDEWIVRARGDDSWTGLATSDEAELCGDSPLATAMGDLSAREQEAFLLGQLPVWMRTGQFNEPIRTLEYLKSQQRLCCAGDLALAEIRITRGELDHGQSALRAAAPASVSAHLAPWFSYLEGVHAHRSGWESEAARHYRKTIQTGDPIGSPYALQARVMLGYTHGLHGDSQRLIALAQDGIARSRKLDDTSRERAFELLLVFGLLRARRTSDVLLRLEGLSAALATPGRPHANAPLLLRAGRIYEDLGHFDSADQAYFLALEQARMTDNPRIIAEGLTFIGDRSIDRGEFAEAHAQHLEALAIRREGHHGAWSIATSLRGAGYAAMCQGMIHQARQLFLEALRYYEGLENEFGAASTLFPLAKLSLAQGKRERSRKCAEAARAILLRHPTQLLSLEIPTRFATLDQLETFLSGEFPEDNVEVSVR